MPPKRSSRKYSPCFAGLAWSCPHAHFSFKQLLLLRLINVTFENATLRVQKVDFNSQDVRRKVARVGAYRLRIYRLRCTDR